MVYNKYKLMSSLPMCHLSTVGLHIVFDTNFSFYRLQINFLRLIQT